LWAGLSRRECGVQTIGFVVKVAQEIHSKQAIDIVVTEVEYVDRKTRQRETERGELG
jgi:hypothetical protein